VTAGGGVGAGGGGAEGGLDVLGGGVNGFETVLTALLNVDFKLNPRPP
jgi:hypothetical protein